MPCPVASNLTQKSLNVSFNYISTSGGYEAASPTPPVVLTAYKVSPSFIKTTLKTIYGTGGGYTYIYIYFISTRGILNFLNATE